MKLSTAKQKFICEWGKLGSNWGINKAMGQIHGLLLVACDDLCGDDIMEELQMSRGNVNMNLRALQDWQLVHKVYKPGQRKDYYKAEKDLSKVLKIIVEHRKKKELDPLMELLEEVECVEPKCRKSSEFCQMVDQLKSFSVKADRALKTITSSKTGWLSMIMNR